MKTTLGIMAVFTAAALFAGAEVSSVSEEAPLDTRSVSAIMDIDDQDLNTRSYTVKWSEARRLNTKKVKGTMILMR